ncbi:MAG TPA: carbonic anhydrase family protein [Paracoccaceae bacterium]|nr:carbonic anhydrase family protein [Paracoccaceae bacterium]
MSRRLALAALFALLASWAARAADGPHWAYEGYLGPEAWGRLGEEYAACATGREQSPIDLTGAVRAELPTIALHWKAAASDVIHNGHAIQVNVRGGGHALIDGERFELVLYHFHAPSEHTVDGRYFPMEVHFVHANAEGRLAVIGVMMVEGALNPLFGTIMSLAPAQEGVSPAGILEPRGLVASLQGLYRYQGSLTTPPCSENVVWTVLRQPVEVGAADIAAFRALFPMNARPLQNRYRRYLLTN